MEAGHNETIASVLSYVPPALFVAIISLLVGFLYKTLKFLIEKTYNEMHDNHDDIKKSLSAIRDDLSRIKYDVTEVKLKLSGYVTVENHYSQVKVVNSDVSEVKERVARLETVRPNYWKMP